MDGLVDGSTRSRSSSISDTLEQFEQNVETLRAILGDDISEDRIKQALRGADGKVDVALNHLLNDKERERDNSISDTNLTPLEKVLCELAEEVKCPMCLGYFKHPLVLTCFHTFCSECLKSLVIEKVIQCPLCRNESKLDEKGLHGLKFNHYLANIVEKLKAAQSTKMCAECQKSICTIFCRQCKGFLCNECNDKIHSIRVLNSHTRMPFEDLFFAPKGSPIIGELASDVDCVVPFNVKKEVCVELFYYWIKELWWAPTDLEKKAVLNDFKVVYIPYWLFEVEVLNKYTCMLGITLGDKVMNPKRQSERDSSRILSSSPSNNTFTPSMLSNSPEDSSTLRNSNMISTQWTSASGSMTHAFKEVAVCAASSNSDILLISEFEPWRLDQLQAFTLKHTEGVEVRAFAMDSETAWKNTAKATVEALSKQLCSRKLRTPKLNSPDTISVANLQVESSFLNKKSRRLFVPIYTATYEYRGKTYQFVVNGSTAKVAGTRPYSVSKLASVSVTGIGAAIGLLSSKLYSL